MSADRRASQRLVQRQTNVGDPPAAPRAKKPGKTKKKNRGTKYAHKREFGDTELAQRLNTFMAALAACIKPVFDEFDVTGLSGQPVLFCGGDVIPRVSEISTPFNEVTNTDPRNKETTEPQFQRLHADVAHGVYDLSYSILVDKKTHLVRDRSVLTCVLKPDEKGCHGHRGSLDALATWAPNQGLLDLDGSTSRYATFKDSSILHYGPCVYNRAVWRNGFFLPVLVGNEGKATSIVDDVNIWALSAFWPVLSGKGTIDPATSRAVLMTAGSANDCDVLVFLQRHGKLDLPRAKAIQKACATALELDTVVLSARFPGGDGTVAVVWADLLPVVAHDSFQVLRDKVNKGDLVALRSLIGLIDKFKQTVESDADARRLLFGARHVASQILGREDNLKVLEELTVDPMRKLAFEQTYETPEKRKQQMEETGFTAVPLEEKSQVELADALSKLARAFNASVFTRFFEATPRAATIISGNVPMIYLDVLAFCLGVDPPLRRAGFRRGVTRRPLENTKANEVLHMEKVFSERDLETFQRLFLEETEEMIQDGVNQCWEHPNRGTLDSAGALQFGRVMEDAIVNFCRQVQSKCNAGVPDDHKVELDIDIDTTRVIQRGAGETMQLHEDAFGPTVMCIPISGPSYTMVVFPDPAENAADLAVLDVELGQVYLISSDLSHGQWGITLEDRIVLAVTLRNKMKDLTKCWCNVT